MREAFGLAAVAARCCAWLRVPRGSCFVPDAKPHNGWVVNKECSSRHSGKYRRPATSCLGERPNPAGALTFGFCPLQASPHYPLLCSLIRASSAQRMSSGAGPPSVPAILRTWRDGEVGMNSSIAGRPATCERYFQQRGLVACRNTSLNNHAFVDLARVAHMRCRSNPMRSLWEAATSQEDPDTSVTCGAALAKPPFARPWVSSHATANAACPIPALHVCAGCMDAMLAPCVWHIRAKSGAFARECRSSHGSRRHLVQPMLRRTSRSRAWAARRRVASRRQRIVQDSSNRRANSNLVDSSPNLVESTHLSAKQAQFLSNQVQGWPNRAQTWPNQAKLSRIKPGAGRSKHHLGRTSPFSIRIKAPSPARLREFRRVPSCVVDVD